MLPNVINLDMFWASTTVLDDMNTVEHSVIHLTYLFIVHVDRFRPDRTNRIGSLTLCTRSCVAVAAQELDEEVYEEARSVLDHQCSVRSRRRSPRGGR